MKRQSFFIVGTVLLGIMSLYMEQMDFSSFFPQLAAHIIDYLLMAIVIAETAGGIVSAKYKRQYFRDNIFSFVFTLLFFILFIYSKFFYHSLLITDLAIAAVFLRTVFLILRVYTRMKRLARYMQRFSEKPAQTILGSFLFVILCGSLLLMMGFTTVNGRGLSILDAFFTATSAVCVTGLSTIDVSSVLSVWGWIILLILIQIGGLGLMAMSFFAVFAVKRRVSLADKLLLSYMLEEDDSRNLFNALKSIIGTAFAVELAGAVLLFIGFIPYYGISLKNIFYAVFHAVSAFCNAGFSLFPDSVERFRANPFILSTLSLLIISGGIGFAVIAAVKSFSVDFFRQSLGKTRRYRMKPAHQYFSLSSTVILRWTAALLFAGTMLFYILEHANTMKEYSLGVQYLNAFFQSVSFRTAGFNSIPFGSFRPAAYILFCFFMFIGAAPGSTAGGIKITTAAVLASSVKSFLRGEKSVRLYNSEVSGDKVYRAFIIFFSGFSAVFISLIAMSLTEPFPTEVLLFEIVSAVGTVGVSAGITAQLSVFAKLIIMLLMFWGRLGALTILSAVKSETDRANIHRPQADISFG